MPFPPGQYGQTEAAIREKDSYQIAAIFVKTCRKQGTHTAISACLHQQTEQHHRHHHLKEALTHGFPHRPLPSFPCKKNIEPCHCPYCADENDVIGMGQHRKKSKKGKPHAIAGAARNPPTIKQVKRTRQDKKIGQSKVRPHPSHLRRKEGDGHGSDNCQPLRHFQLVKNQIQKKRTKQNAHDEYQIHQQQSVVREIADTCPPKPLQRRRHKRLATRIGGLLSIRVVHASAMADRTVILRLPIGVEDVFLDVAAAAEHIGSQMQERLRTEKGEKHCHRCDKRQQNADGPRMPPHSTTSFTT